jgi:hypothetical protein
MQAVFFSARNSVDGFLPGGVISAEGMPELSAAMQSTIRASYNNSSSMMMLSRPKSKSGRAISFAMAVKADAGAE